MHVQENIPYTHLQQSDGKHSSTALFNSQPQIHYTSQRLFLFLLVLFLPQKKTKKKHMMEALINSDMGDCFMMQGS